MQTTKVKVTVKN